MSKTVYQWRPGSRFAGDAKATALELERIRTASGGALKASIVVAEAEPEDAVNHPHFVWDDSEAASLFRLQQARNLIRAVVVKHDDKPAESVYAHVPEIETNEGSYEPLETIYQKPDRYLRAVAEAKADVVGAQRAVEELLRIGRISGKPREEIARIMLAVQALHTANEALAA
jgi:hypothetical protein